MTTIRSTLHETQYAFFIISISGLLKKKNVERKVVKKKKHKFYVQKLFFFFFESRAVYEITNATNTHSKHVTIIGFPRRKWLRERASILRYTLIVY